MKSCLRHPVRVTARLLWLATALLISAFDYALRCALRRNASPALARAEWLQRSATRLLDVFNLEVNVRGFVPEHGLLVANHLSYLDIITLGAVAPAIFVAKSDVRGWPILGFFARLAGTIFVDRNKRAHTWRSADEIETALQAGALVVLFPEGTSSGGDQVLPFRSSLLEPATRPKRQITAAHIQYTLADGVVSEEVCYWKDMTLLPHLLNLLSKDGIRAAVGLKRIAAPAADRKELARQLHSDVAALRQLTDQLSPARGEETNYRPREFGEQPALLRIHSCAESKASL